MPDVRHRLAGLSPESLGLDPFAALSRRYASLYRAPPSVGSTVTVGRQTYRQWDDGRADILVPIADPVRSPSQLAERKHAVQRVMLMEDSPLAGAGYGLVSLANVSPEVRDRALLAGLFADTAMQSLAPLAASVRRPLPPKSQVTPPAWQRPNIRLRDLNAKGQATGAYATLTAPILGTGTKADRRFTPPGWQGNGRKFNEARGHLLGNYLGGPGGLEGRNLITQTHYGSNTPQMQAFERQVARRVRAGEIVEYSATPMYSDDALPPSTILLTATGSRSAPTARLIRNPAGRRK